MTTTNQRAMNLPVPVTVTVYNLLPPGADDRSKSRLFRPDHKVDLLLPVRLEIIAREQEDGEEDENEEEEAEEEEEEETTQSRDGGAIDAVHRSQGKDMNGHVNGSVERNGSHKARTKGRGNATKQRNGTIGSTGVLFSSTLESRNLHPMWDHLNERVPSWDRQSGPWLRSNISQHMRITMLRNKNDETPVVLTTDFPLDPTKLRRLPDLQSNEETFWGEPKRPPKALPPNAVLVHYTDGSIRVLPSLYRALVERGVFSSKELADSRVLADDDEEKKRTTRFDDDVFNVLGNPSGKVVDNNNGAADANSEQTQSEVQGQQLEDGTIVASSPSLSAQSTAKDPTPSNDDDDDDNGVERDAVQNGDSADIKSDLPSQLDGEIDELLEERDILEALIAEEEKRRSETETKREAVSLGCRMFRFFCCAVAFVRFGVVLLRFVENDQIATQTDNCACPTSFCVDTIYDTLGPRGIATIVVGPAKFGERDSRHLVGNRTGQVSP